MSASSNTDEVRFCQPCLPLLCRAAPPPVVSVLCPSVHAQQHRQAHTRAHIHTCTHVHTYTHAYTHVLSAALLPRAAPLRPGFLISGLLGTPPKKHRVAHNRPGPVALWGDSLSLTATQGQLRTSKAQSEADVRGWTPAPGSRGAQTLQCTGMTHDAVRC